MLIWKNYIFQWQKWHLRFCVFCNSASFINKSVDMLSEFFAHSDFFKLSYVKKLNFCWAIIILHKNDQIYLLNFRVYYVAENIGYKAFSKFCKSSEEGPQKQNLAPSRKDETQVTQETHVNFQSEELYHVYWFQKKTN